MLIASQNLSNHNVNLPQDTIYRINLAWIDDLESLKKILEKHKEHKIFLDLPKNRTKPPNNKYSMNELQPFLQSFQNIKYFAISNIDSAGDLSPFLDFRLLLPRRERSKTRLKLYLEPFLSLWQL